MGTVAELIIFCSLFNVKGKKRTFFFLPRDNCMDKRFMLMNNLIFSNKLNTNIIKNSELNKEDFKNNIISVCYNELFENLVSLVLIKMVL